MHGSRNRSKEREDDVFLSAVADSEDPNARRTVPADQAYDLLLRTLAAINSYRIHPFTKEADDLFHRLPKAAHRIGPRDCRIAASAVTGEFTVVTANTSDFGKVAEHLSTLQFVDWSR